MDPEFKFTNGDLVEDKITKFKGRIIARIEWIYGCKRYIVQSEELGKEGKPVDWTFDEGGLTMLEEVKPNTLEKSAAQAGGEPGRYYDGLASERQVRVG